MGLDFSSLFEPPPLPASMARPQPKKAFENTTEETSISAENRLHRSLETKDKTETEEKEEKEDTSSSLSSQSKNKKDTTTATAATAAAAAQNDDGHDDENDDSVVSFREEYDLPLPPEVSQFLTPVLPVLKQIVSSSSGGKLGVLGKMAMTAAMTAMSKLPMMTEIQSKHEIDLPKLLDGFSKIGAESKQVVITFLETLPKIRTAQVLQGIAVILKDDPTMEFLGEQGTKLCLMMMTTMMEKDQAAVCKLVSILKDNKELRTELADGAETAAKTRNISIHKLREILSGASSSSSSSSRMDPDEVKKLQDAVETIVKHAALFQSPSQAPSSQFGGRASRRSKIGSRRKRRMRRKTRRMTRMRRRKTTRTRIAR
jgi:hypothetical protein